MTIIEFFAADASAALLFYAFAANFRVPAMSKIRVGFIGIGNRGMDFIMDLRWAYCLQNGLPLDMDVYDLASWSAMIPSSAYNSPDIKAVGCIW